MSADLKYIKDLKLQLERTTKTRDGLMIEIRAHRRLTFDLKQEVGLQRKRANDTQDKINHGMQAWADLKYRHDGLKKLTVSIIDTLEGAINDPSKGFTDLSDLSKQLKDVRSYIQAGEPQ